MFQHFYEDTAQSIQGVFTLDIDSIWAVTTGGDVLMSSNAYGDTVHFNVDNLADSWLTDVFAVDGHHAWAIGNNGSLYRYGLLEGFPAGGADILDFVVDQQVQPAEINADEQTVHAIVEEGTDLTQLIPEVFISAAASIDPPGGSMQDFTSPFTYTVSSENGQTVKNWVVTVDITTAVSERELPVIVLYPNPARNIVNCQLSTVNGQWCQITVYDLYGKLLICSPLHREGAGSLQLDVSHLPAGLYFIRVQTEDRAGTQKIIIL